MIASKFGFEGGKVEAGLNSKPARIKAVADAALMRLKTDRINLFYQHRVDPDVPIEDVPGTVKELIAAGKVRQFLASWRPALRPSVVPMRCSRLPHCKASIHCGGGSQRRRYCRRLRSLASASFSPLGKGFLTGAMNASTQFDQSDFRNIVPRFSSGARKADQTLVDLLGEIAAARTVTPAQIALAWLLAQKPWIAPIPGTTKLPRLAENIRAADVKLTPDDRAAVAGVLARVAVRGDRYPAHLQARVGR